MRINSHGKDLYQEKSYNMYATFFSLQKIHTLIAIAQQGQLNIERPNGMLATS